MELSTTGIQHQVLNRLCWIGTYCWILLNRKCWKPRLSILSWMEYIKITRPTSHRQLKKANLSWLVKIRNRKIHKNKESRKIHVLRDTICTPQSFLKSHEDFNQWCLQLTKSKMSTKGIHFCLHVSKHSAVQSSLPEVLKHRVDTYSPHHWGISRAPKWRNTLRFCAMEPYIHWFLPRSHCKTLLSLWATKVTENLMELYLLPPLPLLQHATLRIATIYKKSMCTSSDIKQLTLRGPSLKTIYLWISQPMTSSCYQYIN